MVKGLLVHGMEVYTQIKSVNETFELMKFVELIVTSQPANQVVHFVIETSSYSIHTGRVSSWNEWNEMSFCTHCDTIE